MNTFQIAFLIAIVVAAGIGLGIGVAERHNRRDAKRVVVVDIEITRERTWSLAIEDPTEDEPMVPIVPGSTEPELVDELPVRARAIEVPRVGEPKGAVLQGRWRPCTPCFDAHADQKPELMRHDACRRVFYGVGAEA